MGTSSGISVKRIGRVRDMLSGCVERGEIAGGLTLAWRRGETFVETAGSADIESGTPIKRDTIFRIASMSKAITAVGAMILVEEAKLRLDDSVEKWLPELANRKVLRTLESPLDDTVPANRPITLRDLLTFRFGMGVVMAMPGTYPIQAAISEAKVAPGPIAASLTNDEWMANLGNLPLVHQPGEKWLYHTGSDAAGVLIARVTGMSLGAFLKERIFDPLRMHDTGFWVPEEKIGRLATSYRKQREGGLVVFDPAKGGAFSQPPKFEAGGGGLVCTADDYLVFARMLMNLGAYEGERIVSRPTVELMISDQISAKQKELSPFSPGFWETDGWGFGFSVTTHSQNIGPRLGSYGWTGGMGTYWRNDPREEMITLYLNQRMMTSPNDLQVSDDFTSLAYSSIED